MSKVILSYFFGKIKSLYNIYYGDLVLIQISMHSIYFNFL